MSRTSVACCLATLGRELPRAELLERRRGFWLCCCLPVFGVERLLRRERKRGNKVRRPDADRIVDQSQQKSFATKKFLPFVVALLRTTRHALIFFPEKKGNSFSFRFVTGTSNEPYAFLSSQVEEIFFVQIFPAHGALAIVGIIVDLAGNVDKVAAKQLLSIRSATPN